jgi:integrase
MDDTKMVRGFVSVSINSNDRLQLTFPRWIARKIGKSRLSISLDLPNTKENRKIAEDKAFEINTDIAYGKFRGTSKETIRSFYQVSISAGYDNPTQLSLDLWEKYKADKALTLKPKSMEALDYYSQVLSKIECVPHYEVKEKLLSVTSSQVARKILMYLSGCYEWGVVNGLVSDNPYKGRFSELPKPDWLTEPEPNPFTREEKETIIARFNEHETCQYYSPIIQFLFLTGCRPSEAVGLKQNSIKKRTINFRESIVLIKGRSTPTKKSKNNKVRTFPISVDLFQLTESLNISNTDNLVFPSKNGRPINLNYLRKIWVKIVDPIKADTTLYCCRDTFITEQISNGIPPAIIAKWVDSSVAMIEKYYLKAESTDWKPL